MRNILAVTMAAVLLGGCGVGKWFSRDRDQAPPSATLPPAAPAPVQRLWRRDIGPGGGVRDLRLVPAAAGDAVYAADADGTVVALAADSGKVRWQRRLKAAITGATGAGGGLVLLGTQEGEVIALAQADGAPRWRAQLSSEVLSPPAAAGGVVVARSVDGKVFGLTAGEGQKLWIYERGVPGLTLRGTSAPVIHGGRVFTGFASGRLAANDLKTGQVLWEALVSLPRGRNELERLVDVDTQPLVMGDTLYAAAYQGKVVALGVADGRLRWERTASTYNDLAADDRHLYLTDEAGRVIALDRASGAPAWRQEALKGRRLGAPAVVGGHVAVVDGAGWLHLLDPADGRLTGRARLEGKHSLSRPVVAGDRLFLLSRDGTLLALRVGGAGRP